MFWTMERIYFTCRSRTAIETAVNFSKKGRLDNTIIDSIPFEEIESVLANEREAAQAGTSDLGVANGLSSIFTMRTPRKVSNVPTPARHIGSSSFNRQSHIFDSSEETVQIRTEPDGFNSGRCYYFKLAPERCGAAVADLRALSRSARESREAMTRFKRNQEGVRRIYMSTPFQYTIALLIIAVPARWRAASAYSYSSLLRKFVWRRTPQ